MIEVVGEGLLGDLFSLPTVGPHGELGLGWAPGGVEDRGGGRLTDVDEDLSDGLGLGKDRNEREGSLAGGTDQRKNSIHEAKTFFGLTLEDQTDIVLLLMEEHVVKEVLEAIETAGEFDKPGTGIAFVLPVEQVIGMESQMEIFKERVRDKYF